ncbi:hypothetical protein L7F22_060212 [Adiantum nelumboides]|nr:hypothetical protein [Adiantum nelumboides]
MTHAGHGYGETQSSLHCLQNMKLYETQTRYYLIGRDKSRSHWRVLKIDRSEPSELNLFEDPGIYTSQDIKDLLSRLGEGNRSCGEVNFVTKAYGIVGFVKFLKPYYMVLITKREQIGTICGHSIYGIRESKLLRIPHHSVLIDSISWKIEERYKRLFSSIDLSKNFFYSHTYRIMWCLQKNVLEDDAESMPFDDMFVWNSFLTREFRNQIYGPHWTVALVHGFFKQIGYVILGALDAHQKLVDNWSEHLQSVMWRNPQPHEITQLEIAKKPKLSRTTRRRQNRELSQQQKGIEDKAQSIEQKEAIDIHSAPKHFKSYTTGDCKVVYTKAQRTPINGSSGVYDGPIIVKEIQLAKLGEESKPVFIAQDLTEVEEALLKELLKEFKDIFAWTYHDMKGVPPSVLQHTIPMISTAKSVQQRPYPMNPKYTKIVQEELEKLIECGFIYPIEHLEWLSPIVIVLKKNEKLRVCVDLKKVNAATRRGHYRLPY